jgi:hypothetical protein
VGIGDSVAVQVGSPSYPVTVNEAGVASKAEALAGEAVPPFGEQDSITVTDAPSFGTKSFATSNVSLFSVFVIVQFDDPPFVITTFWQFVSSAV